MSYRAELEKCEVLLNGLLLPDNSFVTTGNIRAYYGSCYLGEYKVEKVIKNLDKFNEEMSKIKRARLKDLALGVIIIYDKDLDEIARLLAKKYFG
jgi:hypothetical protein